MENKIPKPRFPSVKAAREALKAEASEILKEFQDMIRMAAAQGDWESALKAQQWLVDHIPDEEGTRVFGASNDKQNTLENKPTGPLIQIGVIVGGTSNKQLPKAVVINPVEIDE